MSRPIVQKPLGWLQRFLYNVEYGPLQVPTPVVTVDHDWPLEVQRISITDTTIVGTISPTIYAPGQEKHGIVYLLSSFRSSAGSFPQADIIGFNFVDATGLAIRAVTHDGAIAMDHVPLIGSLSVYGSAGIGVPIRGIDAIYVPPGASLQYIHASGTAGNTLIVLGSVVERPRSYPLRLP